MKYICSKCNKEFENNRKRTCCYDCIPARKTYSSSEEALEARRQKVVKNVQRRREKVKHMAVEYKGGKCERCGYNKCIEALEFHHLDPSEKDFAISSKGYTRSWESVKNELDKCIMLCANCHREIHNEE